jgi:16S rRNA (uracil1498-N3)-methyltransferase
MHYFYSKDISDTEICLSKEEAHHASRVLRLKIGDKVGVFDGEGVIYHCSINELNKHACKLSIDDSIISAFPRPNLTMLIAPTKSNERFEWFLEKACEIGVGKIVPILTYHSERKHIRLDRFEKVLQSAMKQSMNPYLPIIEEMSAFKEEVAKYKHADRYISHCAEGNKKELIDVISDKNESVIMIGPEGDFSSEEIQMALREGWQEVSLGHQRFRSETAGVLAVHMHSLKNRV